MRSQEQRTTLYLASIYAFRMMGLFMILPVFSLYAHSLKQATPTLIGLALGIYGLTQACLQIPFAMASDRVGRKPVILFGLILFMTGSLIAASSHNIYGIILGRALQGAGAIGSTLMALVADHTREEFRLKAMAIVGMSIGLSFMLAMILGPLIDQFIGLSGIFSFTAILAFIGMLIVLFRIPRSRQSFHRDTEAVVSQFKNILLNLELLRLNIGVFCSHAILMALFIALPLVLNSVGLNAAHQWMIYLPALLFAGLTLFPMVILAEKKRWMKSLFIIAIFTMALIQFFFFSHHLISLGICLAVFFAAFTFLEACLPSLVSKIAPVGSKGTAMGIYSTFQFSGIFVGGTLGGFIFSHWNTQGVFLFCALLGLIWGILASTMKAPPYLSSKILPVEVDDADEAAALEIKLRSIDGVEEAIVYLDEQAAYLKVDRKRFLEASLESALSNRK